MLLVLIVLSTLTFLLTIGLRSMSINSTINKEIYQFQSVLDIAKSCSIVNRTDATISIANNSYIFSCNDMSKTYDTDNISISSNVNKDIVFNKEGIINMGRTIKFYKDEYNKELVITIGRSSSYVK